MKYFTKSFLYYQQGSKSLSFLDIKNFYGNQIVILFLSDNLGLIIGVSVGVPLGLLAIILIVVVCIYVNKKSRRHDKYSER